MSPTAKGCPQLFSRYGYREVSTIVKARLRVAQMRTECTTLVHMR